MTEAGFWGFVRSGLRSKSQRWKPIYDALAAARRPSESLNQKLKWEFRCALCAGWFKRTDVQVDHIVPAGSLRCPDDLPGFVTRLFCELDGLRILCTTCHQGVAHV